MVTETAHSQGPPFPPRPRPQGQEAECGEGPLWKLRRGPVLAFRDILTRHQGLQRKQTDGSQLLPHPVLGPSRLRSRGGQPAPSLTSSTFGLHRPQERTVTSTEQSPWQGSIDDDLEAQGQIVTELLSGKAGRPSPNGHFLV